MKTLGLCSFLLCVLLSSVAAQDLLSAPAQETSKPSLLNPDKEAVQKWLAHAGPMEWSGLEGDRLIVSSADTEVTCAFMRTYRVRREHRGSDVVRPAGYTKCVPTRRFEMKSAVQVQPIPE
jgi:hypothetical protein